MARIIAEKLGELRQERLELDQDGHANLRIIFAARPDRSIVWPIDRERVESLIEERRLERVFAE